MSNKGWVETVASAQSDGPAKSSFTTAVSILPDHARYVIPGGSSGQSLYWAGQQLRLTASGRISNVVTSQPTFTFEVRMGPASAVVAFSTGALTCSTTAHTNLPWWLDVLLTLRSPGATAAFMGQAIVHSQVFVASGATADGANTHTMLMGPNTAPTVGSTFDTTGANMLDLFCGCSASNASNAITLHQYSLQSLN